MRSIIFIFMLLISLSACKSDSNKYQITANIDGVKDGSKVTLRAFKDNKPIEIDTTSVRDGAFSFEGSVEQKDIHLLSIQNVSGSLPFILENKNLKFTLYKDSLSLSKIEGSKENDIAQDFVKSMSSFKKENDALRKEFTEARTKNDTAFLKSFNEKMSAIIEKNQQYNIDFVKDNNNSLFSVLLLENLANSKALTPQEVKEIFSSYSKELQESNSGMRINQKIIATLSTADGAIAPDFTAPSPDGEDITLSEIRGKVTIVDFWAAWCGPCRKENPNVVKVYEKYHDKGLEIIGVSLDGNPRQKDAKQAWINAIEKDGLTWYQVSNLNYFNGPVAKKYNIRSIPATFILDSEGKIVARNLRGPALEKKIAELLD